jgi:hypothetical protein
MTELLTPDELGRGLIITVEDYMGDERKHELADRLLAALGYHPNQVVELRATRHVVSVLVMTRGPGGPTERWHKWTIDGRRFDDDDHDE